MKGPMACSSYTTATAAGTSRVRLNSMNSPPLTRRMGPRRMAVMRTGGCA